MPKNTSRRSVGFLLLPIALCVAVFGGVLPLWLLKATTDLSAPMFNLIATVWAAVLVVAALYLVGRWENRGG
jgi:hypothetical protein